MIRYAQAGAAMAALLALAACNVKVNDQSVDNKLDAAGNDIDNAGEAIGAAADKAGAAVENEADKIGDRIDNMSVNIDVNTQGNEADEDPD